MTNEQPVIRGPAFADAGLFTASGLYSVSDSG